MHKNIIKLLFVLVTCFIAINSLLVYAIDYDVAHRQTESSTSYKTTSADKEFGCSNPNINRAVGVVAEILLWIRIVVPIIIVIVGSISFAKAVISQDDNDIKEVFYSLMKKIIIGALIFVIPTIIIVSMKTIVKRYSTDNSSWAKCIELLK